MAPARRGASGQSLDGEIVRFSCATREDDIAEPRADERTHLLARLLHGFARLPAEGMVAARRVAEVLGKKREHCLEHTRIDRRRSVRVR
jgi:hypothetical protein